MVGRPIGGLVDRARDWWASRAHAADGAAIDPAYNGWYVTAVPRHEADADGEDDAEPASVDDHP